MLLLTVIVGSILYVAVALVAYTTGFNDGKQGR